MARRPFSFPLRSEGGPVLGGTASELRLYDEATLTTLSTIYADSASATTLPNPRIPNAGRQTALLADRLAADTFVTVVDITGFNVGDFIPIYNGTTTAYRVITVITAGTRRFDIEPSLGSAFSATNTVVGNLDMKGHVYGWVDDVRDYYFQSKNVASTRVLPPMMLPTRVPISAVGILEEGVTAGTRTTLNFIGPSVTAVDNGAATRVDVTLTGLMVGGTAALPSHSFAGDPNTGMYNHNPDQLGLSTGGATAAIIDTGQVTAYGYLQAGLATTDQGRLAGGVGAVTLSALGGSANINMNLVTKGTGVLQVNGIAILTNINSRLAADVAMPVDGTAYNGPSVALTAGTWLITAQVLITEITGATPARVAAEIWLDTVGSVASAQSRHDASLFASSMHMSTIATVAGAVNAYVRGYSTATNAVMRATTESGSASAVATQITAVRLG